MISDFLLALPHTGISYFSPNIGGSPLSIFKNRDMPQSRYLKFAPGSSVYMEFFVYSLSSFIQNLVRKCQFWSSGVCYTIFFGKLSLHYDKNFTLVSNFYFSLKNSTNMIFEKFEKSFKILEFLFLKKCVVLCRKKLIFWSWDKSCRPTFYFTAFCFPSSQFSGCRKLPRDGTHASTTR